MRRFGLLRPRRRLLMRSGFVILALTYSIHNLPLHAQTDCVFPTLHISQLHGMITDQGGNPIPGASVFLSREPNPVIEARTDSMGRFFFNGVSGKYDFRVASTGFAKAWSPIDIGFDLRSLFHSNTLRVVLVVGYDSCPILTTDKRVFKGETRAYNRRFKGSEQ